MIAKKVCSIIACLVATTTQAQYYQPFAPYYSQVGQDKYVVEEIFHHKKHGVFVDIGAHDGISYSNTYYLEKELGWSGICIEPQPDQFQALQRNRKCICVEGGIFNQSGEQDFLLVKGPSEMLSGLASTYDLRHLQRADREISYLGGSRQFIKIKTYTLNEICKKHNISHIDFLSIDTEGSEEAIIKSIDFDALPIHVITVENNYNSPVIHNYLTQKGYTFLCKFVGDEIYINHALEDRKHYYCTPSDERHFHLLKNLIGSIHHVDFDNVGEIAVFDLGLTSAQRHELSTMQKVHVYDVEMTNPHLLTYFQTCPSGRSVRGYFAWKPVIIKQALKKFPYVLYLDAGTTVLRPLNEVFECIRQQGYFLVSCSDNANCNIINRITKKVVDTVVKPLPTAMQCHLLDEGTIEIDAGLQGLSRSMLTNYVMPLYQHSTDLSLFADDGSARLGYGAGRHDQILFSIYAHALKLNIFREGWFIAPLQPQSIMMHCHHDATQVNEATCIYRSRHNTQFQGGKTQYIKYR